MSPLRAGVFLDRDGTINLDPGYLRDPDRVRLFDGVPAALARLRELGMSLIVVSNQSGIGRGLITKTALASVNRRIFELAGVEPDRIFFCPHHPVEALGWYRRRCRCRKPGTAMVERAARQLGLDLAASYFVGDSPVDLACGRAAGMTTVLVLTGVGNDTLEQVQSGRAVSPDHVAPDLGQAAQWIEAHRREHGRIKGRRTG